MRQTESRIPNNAFLAARLILGVVLLASGLLKILSPAEEFAAAIGAYKVIPDGLVIPLAKYLPWLEYTLGGFLLTGYLIRASSLVSAALFTLFLSLLTFARFQGIVPQECGCFGSLGPHLSPRQVSFLDALCAWLGLVVFFDKKRIFSLDRWLS